MDIAIKDFRNKIKEFDDVEYMVNVIVFNAAPTIKELKAGTTVTLCNHDKNMKNNWKVYKEELLERLKLKAFELKETEDAVVVLFYKEELLKNKLGNEPVKTYLKKFGYKPEMTLYEKLTLLKKRYEKNACPHELGLFLGFPLDDVKIFIESPHSECLICGYWKVYKDEHYAMKTFENFDAAKLEIINKVCSGLSLTEILDEIA
ncbi:DUF3793 family protein [Clostridium senegalense]|uniref:DUF3793 family protein n=1 Tax=Clostridium senegalense TaxID=1465809 RepID=UPI001C128176|nr:DUF3793 family protein [Clostridium senegalense]MBU5226765.1 DUF3793 family protein [Clostridium senegalense]